MKIENVVVLYIGLNKGLPCPMGLANPSYLFESSGMGFRRLLGAQSEF